MLIEFLVAFLIAAICAVIHLTTLIRLLEWLLRKKAKFDRRHGFRHFTPLLLFVFSIITVLHILEACIWAAFYASYKLFPDWETSIYFSLGSYTTIGYGDVVLPQNWRILGGIEGITGVLLCGVSTAIIFAIVSVLFRIRVEQLYEGEKSIPGKRSRR